MLLNHDVRTVYEMRRRHEPAMIVRYDELLREPAQVAHNVHAFLGVRTNVSALNAFVQQHLPELPGLDGTHAAADDTYGTIRAGGGARCREQTPLNEIPECLQLLRVARPLFDC